MKYISLYPNEREPNAFYVQILMHDRSYIRKLFSFKNYDSVDAALEAAREFRDFVAECEWNKPFDQNKKRIVSPTIKRQQRVYNHGKKNNSSGITGVVHNIKQLAYGSYSTMWTALWRENGRERRKSFTYNGMIGKAKNRTSDEAMQMAYDHRQKMVELHYKN